MAPACCLRHAIVVAAVVRQWPPATTSRTSLCVMWREFLGTRVVMRLSPRVALTSIDAISLHSPVVVSLSPSYCVRAVLAPATALVCSSCSGCQFGYRLPTCAKYHVFDRLSHVPVALLSVRARTCQAWSRLSWLTHRLVLLPQAWVYISSLRPSPPSSSSLQLGGHCFLLTPARPLPLLWCLGIVAVGLTWPSPSWRGADHHPPLRHCVGAMRGRHLALLRRCGFTFLHRRMVAWGLTLVLCYCRRYPRPALRATWHCSYVACWRCSAAAHLACHSSTRRCAPRDHQLRHLLHHLQ